MTAVDGETKRSVVNAVTRLSGELVDAAALLKLWSGRWDIEKRLFWVRDVAFREDLSRIRTGTAHTTMGVFRDEGITLLRALEVPELTAAIREHAVNINVLLQRLNTVNKT